MFIEPLVSIIIPVYNGSDFLEQAINSALSQTYNNIEILVINDGSTDNGATEKIALSYGDKIRYFSKENGGVSTALNTGIKNMKGDFFSWLSHDDIYMPDKIALQIEFLKKNPSARLIASDFILKEESTGKTTEFRLDKFRTINNCRQLLSTWVFACTMLVHKSCFDEAGLFNEENKTTQDTEMEIKLVAVTPCFVLDQPLVIHRSHQAQTSKINRKKHIADIDNFIIRILNTFDLNLFSEVKIESKNTLFDTYIWLGDFAIRSLAYKAATTCYRRALKLKPFSPLLLFQSVIGLKTWFYFKRLLHKK